MWQMKSEIFPMALGTSNVRAETLENNCKAKDRNELHSYMETNPNGTKTADNISPAFTGHHDSLPIYILHLC